MLTDAHLHLQNDVFDADRTDVLTAAAETGIGRFLCAAESLNDSEKLLELARKQPQIVPFAGTHPWHAATHDDKRFLKLLQKHPSAGVGETGLDGLKKNPFQQSVFVRHVSAAVACDRPFVVHCVKAAAELIGILKQFPDLPPFLCHAFAGGKNEIDFLAKKGGFFSVNGRMLSRPRFQEKLAFFPPERLLIETDSPFMRPNGALCVNAAEKRNVPANLSLTFKKLAQMLTVDETALMKRLNDNTAAFLREKK